MLASFFRGTQTVRDKCYVTHWGVGVSAFPEKALPSTALTSDDLDTQMAPVQILLFVAALFIYGRTW